MTGARSLETIDFSLLFFKYASRAGIRADVSSGRTKYFTAPPKDNIPSLPLSLEEVTERLEETRERYNNKTNP